MLTFVHCMTTTVPETRICMMEDIIFLVRTDFRNTYEDMLTLALTLVFTISSNSTTNCVCFTNEADMVTEIETIQPFVENLKENMSLLAAFYNPNSTNLYPDNLLTFIWYHVNLRELNILQIIETRHIKSLKSMYFYHNNNHPVTADLNMYPTNWNHSMFDITAVILSLLFKPNKTAAQIIKIKLTSEIHAMFQPFLKQY